MKPSRTAYHPYPYLNTCLWHSPLINYKLYQMDILYLSIMMKQVIWHLDLFLIRRNNYLVMVLIMLISWLGLAWKFRILLGMRGSFRPAFWMAKGLSLIMASTVMVLSKMARSPSRFTSRSDHSQVNKN